mgnify:CR=1 FL=1
MPDAIARVRSGLIRQCPVCDGYEVQGQRVAVMGPIREAIKKALFLRTWTSELTVLATEAGVTVDGANVTATDIAASNGVIHVIDTVILPPKS